MQIVRDYIKNNEKKISCFKQMRIPKQDNITKKFKLNTSRLDKDASNLIEFSLDIPGHQIEDDIFVQQLKKNKHLSPIKNKRVSMKKIPTSLNKSQHLSKKKEISFIKQYQMQLNERFDNAIKYKLNNSKILKTVNTHTSEPSINVSKEMKQLTQRKPKKNVSCCNIMSLHYNQNQQFLNDSYKKEEKKEPLTDREYTKKTLSTASSKKNLCSSNLDKVIQNSANTKKKFTKVLSHINLTKKSILLLRKQNGKSFDDTKEQINSLQKDIDEGETSKKKNKYDKDELEILKRRNTQEIKHSQERAYIQKSHADLINFCDNYYKMEDQGVYERRKNIIKEYPLLRKEANVAEKDPEKPHEKRDKLLRKNSHTMNYLYEKLQQNINLIKKKYK